MTAFTAKLAHAQESESRDCAAMRIENGWSRAEYRDCRRVEMQREIDWLDAEFAMMRDWLRARGLDVTDAGVITDPEGRALAQIALSNAALAAGNADLAAGNAALRAEITDLELSIETSREDYRLILEEFEQAVLRGN